MFVELLSVMRHRGGLQSADCSGLSQLCLSQLWWFVDSLHYYYQKPGKETSLTTFQYSVTALIELILVFIALVALNSM